MVQNTNRKYDLEERTFEFAKNVRNFTKLLLKVVSNLEYSRQLIRSSASVGANYIEANESFSKKDFLLRIKICRKEAKESIYWLNLVDIEYNQDLEKKRKDLAQEGKELMLILSTIMRKSV